MSIIFIQIVLTIIAVINLCFGWYHTCVSVDYPRANNDILWCITMLLVLILLEIQKPKPQS